MDTSIIVSRLCLFWALAPLAFACASGPAPEPKAGGDPTGPTAEVETSPRAEPARPTADQLFETALSVAGGRDRLLALEGYEGRGYLHSPQGMSGQMKILARAPNLVRTTLELGPGLIFEEGYDGELAWSRDPIAGARIKTDEEAREAIRRGDIHAAANYRKHYPEREVVGPTNFEGQPAWEVRVKTSTGREELHYFHAESGRAVGFSAQVVTPMGEVPFVSLYEAWVDVAGLEMPKRLTNRVSTVVQVLTFESFEMVVPPPDAFRVPEDVEALRADVQ